MKPIKTNKYFLKAIVFSLLLFLFSRISYAQNKIIFDKITVEDGLSQTSVISIAQDSLGFMWFGTKDGLNRYDSRYFEIFKNVKKDSLTISSNQNINAILTDKKGNLWVGTQRGLNQYISATKTFKRYLNIPNNKSSLSNNTIRCLYQDRQGNIWIGTENGLNKLKPDGTFERYFCENSKGYGLVGPLIKSVFQDANQNLWIGTQSGLAKIVYANGLKSIKTFYHKPGDENSLTASDITSITEDANHNIWIATHFSGLDVLDQTKNVFKHYNTKNSAIASNIIRKLIIDNQGNLWVGTINGLSILNLKNLTFTNYNQNPDDITSLNQNSVYDIYKDNNGSIWVGTYYGGVNVHHQYSNPFQIYKHNSNKNSVSSNIISALAEDNQNNLWIGTEAAGLNYFDRKNNVFVSYKYQSNKNSVSSNLIKAISLDAQNNLWIAAYEGGLDYFNAKTKTFKSYNIYGSATITNKRITYVDIDKTGKVWVATKGNGLFYYNKLTDNFVSCKATYKKYYLPFLNISFLFTDKSNKLWVTTDEGLFYLPNNGTTFIKVFNADVDFFNQISTINQLSNDKIILGSFSSGLGILDLNKRSLKFYTVKSGLPSNNITGVLEDNKKAIWVSTDKGLAQIRNNSIKIYNVYDGLSGNVFNYHSAIKDKSGNLFFGGYSGLVKVEPNKININKKEPKLAFTNLKVANEVVNVNPQSDFLNQSLNEIEELEFSHQQNLFSVDFASLNFIKPQKNKFAYRLDGFENNWNYVNTPTVTFTNLPSGKYELLIKGTNNDGVWSNSYRKLKIIINPPFWLTWWAYLVYFIAFGSLLYLIFRYLLIEASLKKEHEVNEMKLAFFTNVSHEIRTPLSLILGPLEILVKETQTNLSLNKQLQIVDKNAKRLMKLVNELMDFRKIESGKMKLNVVETDIVAFTKEIFLSFQHIALQRNIKFLFESQLTAFDVFIDIQQLEKILFNLLANALKFASQKDGFVSVIISKSDENIIVSVNDNGQGVPEEDKEKLFTTFYQSINKKEQRNTGTGIGLALSRNIARLHYGDLYLENNTKLTTFSLKLKLGNSHFKPDEVNNFIPEKTEIDNNFQSDLKTILDTDLEQSQAPLITNVPLILIVDDNQELRNFLVSSLKKSFQTITASNGSEALKIAFDKIPDVIISDVMMPVMDGFELCYAIKTDIRTRHVPIVLLTARSGDLHELEGLKTGADVYLTKPFSLQKLELTVQNLLSLQKNMQEKFSHHFTVDPSQAKIESKDEDFLNKVVLLLEENINNPDFNVNFFAAEIGMSTPVFYKKMYALTGLTVNNFIKSIRLKRAMQLLQKNAGNISEIAYQVGFNDAKYFGKEFRKQYGDSPSKFTQKKEL